MNYLSDGSLIHVGDYVIVEDGASGRVVCDFVRWTCITGYEHFLTKNALADGSTIADGILVDTDKYGIIHYSENDFSIQRMQPPRIR